MTESEARGKIKYRIANEMNATGGDKEAYEDLEIALQVMKELREYRELGTVEELQAMKENGAFSGVELAQIVATQMKLKEYKAIGTVEELQDLKEKNDPKKMDRYYCPICRHYFEDGEVHNYCPRCGQKLD